MSYKRTYLASNDMKNLALSVNFKRWRRQGCGRFERIILALPWRDWEKKSNETFSRSKWPNFLDDLAYCSCYGYWYCYGCEYCVSVCVCECVCVCESVFACVCVCECVR
jgi:hypothetical protein